jgi:CheY-like chemotaxis protein
MLAHDIRGALSSVIGGIALIDRGTVDGATRVQLDRVSAAAEALSTLVGDALAEPAAVVVPAAGAAEPGAAAEVDLVEFLRLVAQRWPGEAEAKGLRFALVAGPGLPARLRVDPGALSRVLGNLIGNAVKFSDAGTVRLAVGRKAGGDIAFVVEDDGPGIGEHDALRAFDFGYRNGAGKPGHGIGLHIAKTLTEAMGGRISLATRPEGGARATLVLPASLGEGIAGGGLGASAGGGLAATGRSGSGGDPGGLPDLLGLRVLLAEDNPTNQMVASQMLASMNAEVVLASDGIEALALFETNEVDLLIVDIEMPRMSGLDVIRAIRARSDRRGRTPIVALTAYAMKEHRERISEAGADGLISKPIVSVAAFGRSVAAIAGHRARAMPLSASAEQQGDGSPVIDVATYDALAEAIGPEMMAELLDRVVADLETAGARLRRAANPIDLATVRESSHILISVAGAVGAVRLQTCARALNTEAHASGASGLTGGIEGCLAEIGAALRFVRDQRARC